MDFRLLGPLEVTERGRQVALGGPKQRSVLALLLLHANETVSLDRIGAALWGDRAPPTATKSIQVHVSRLRKDLGADRLATRAPGYVLHVGPDELDLVRFRALMRAARARPHPPTPPRCSRDALALWRGDPLADLAYEPFARPQIARLEELRLAALEARVDADLAVGRHAELVGELEPSSSSIRCASGFADSSCSRCTDPVGSPTRWTRTARHRTVSEELGLEPSAELQALERDILRHDPGLQPPASPVVPAHDPARADPSWSSRSRSIVPMRCSSSPCRSHVTRPPARS